MCWEQLFNELEAQAADIEVQERDALVEELRDVIQGVYIIPTFGRYDFAAGVIESARTR